MGKEKKSKKDDEDETLQTLKCRKPSSKAKKTDREYITEFGLRQGLRVVLERLSDKTLMQLKDSPEKTAALKKLGSKLAAIKIPEGLSACKKENTAQTSIEEKEKLGTISSTENSFTKFMNEKSKTSPKKKYVRVRSLKSLQQPVPKPLEKLEVKKENEYETNIHIMRMTPPHIKLLFQEAERKIDKCITLTDEVKKQYREDVLSGFLQAQLFLERRRLRIQYSSLFGDLDEPECSKIPPGVVEELRNVSPTTTLMSCKEISWAIAAYWRMYHEDRQTVMQARNEKKSRVEPSCTVTSGALAKEQSSVNINIIVPDEVVPEDHSNEMETPVRLTANEMKSRNASAASSGSLHKDPRDSPYLRRSLDPMTLNLRAREFVHDVGLTSYGNDNAVRDALTHGGSYFLDLDPMTYGCVIQLRPLLVGIAMRRWKNGGTSRRNPQSPVSGTRLSLFLHAIEYGGDFMNDMSEVVREFAKLLMDVVNHMGARLAVTNGDRSLIDEEGISTKDFATSQLPCLEEMLRDLTRMYALTRGPPVKPFVMTEEDHVRRRLMKPRVALGALPRDYVLEKAVLEGGWYLTYIDPLSRSNLERYREDIKSDMMQTGLVSTTPSVPENLFMNLLRCVQSDGQFLEFLHDRHQRHYAQLGLIMRRRLFEDRNIPKPNQTHSGSTDTNKDKDGNVHDRSTAVPATSSGKCVPDSDVPPLEKKKKNEATLTDKVDLNKLRTIDEEDLLEEGNEEDTDQEDFDPDTSNEAMEKSKYMDLVYPCINVSSDNESVPDSKNNTSQIVNYTASTIILSSDEETEDDESDTSVDFSTNSTSDSGCHVYNVDFVNDLDATVSSISLSSSLYVYDTSGLDMEGESSSPGASDDSFIASDDEFVEFMAQFDGAYDNESSTEDSSSESNADAPSTYINYWDTLGHNNPQDSDDESVLTQSYLDDLPTQEKEIERSLSQSGSVHEEQNLEIEPQQSRRRHARTFHEVPSRLFQFLSHLKRSCSLSETGQKKLYNFMLEFAPMIVHYRDDFPSYNTLRNHAVTALPKISVTIKFVDEEKNITWFRGDSVPKEGVRRAKDIRLITAQMDVNDLLVYYSQFHYGTESERAEATIKNERIVMSSDGVTMSNHGKWYLHVMSLVLPNCSTPMPFMAHQFRKKTKPQPSINDLYDAMVDMCLKHMIYIDIVCDGKEQNKLAGLKGTGGQRSCRKCLNVGKSRSNGRTTYYPLSEDEGARTDRHYRDTVKNVPRDEGQPRLGDGRITHGIKEVSPLLRMKSFNMVDDIKIDALHLLHEGICKKMFEDMVKNVGPFRHASSSNNFMEIVNDVIVKTKLPVEFKFRTRQMEAAYKGKEYQLVDTFLLVEIALRLKDALVRNKLPWNRRTLLVPGLLLGYIFIVRICYAEPEEFADFQGERYLPEVVMMWLRKYKYCFTNGTDQLGTGEQLFAFNLHLLRHVAKYVADNGPLYRTCSSKFEGSYRQVVASFNPSTLNVPKMILQNFHLGEKEHHKCHNEPSNDFQPKVTEYQDNRHVYLKGSSKFFVVEKVLLDGNVKARQLQTSMLRTSNEWELPWWRVGIYCYEGEQFVSDDFVVLPPNQLGKALVCGRSICQVNPKWLVG